MALSSRKRRPTLALHIGARKSSAVSSCLPCVCLNARYWVQHAPRSSFPVPPCTNQLPYFLDKTPGRLFFWGEIYPAFIQGQRLYGWAHPVQCVH